MLSLVIIGATMMATVQSVEPGRQFCTNRVGIGNLVPTREVAQGIAEAIIRSRQTSDQMAKFVLSVEGDSSDPTKWIVAQGLPQPPPPPSGMIWVQAGGGGIFMRIDKCTGEVSDVHYIR